MFDNLIVWAVALWKTVFANIFPPQPYDGQTLRFGSRSKRNKIAHSSYDRAASVHQRQASSRSTSRLDSKSNAESVMRSVRPLNICQDQR
jgi:hypothetical protein